MTGLLSFLRDNDRYLLLTHARPDGDTLGSAAGLCLGLRALGKTAHLAPNPDVTPRYAPLVTGLFAPDGYRFSRVVSLDTAARALLHESCRELPVDWRIDHHPSFGRESYAASETVDTSAAACGQIVIEALRGLGVTLTPEISDPLYLALTTDTGCFRYSSTTARTLRLAAELMEAGADTAGINNMVFFSKTHARIAIEASVLNSVEYYRGGEIAAAFVTLDAIRAAGACEDDLENVSALARQIAGVNIAVTLREEPDLSCKVSVRTSAPHDAGEICRRLGGGGHARAAGANIAATLEGARKIVLDAVGEVAGCPTGFCS